MSKPKGVYDNAATGDTSFRRTWDREEYAQKAKERETREAKERKERYEAKLAGIKYVPKHDINNDGDEEKKQFDEAKMIEARRERIRLDENLNKVQLVPLGSTGGRRGKGPGYYCEACDLNFTNNVEYVEHLNSKQHLNATGQSGFVERATLEMVRERLSWLKKKKHEQQKEEEFDLLKRLDERQKVEEEERRVKKERKKIKKEEMKKKKEEEQEGAKTVQDDSMDANDDVAMMARMMGFGGFGSTKVR